MLEQTVFSLRQIPIMATSFYYFTVISGHTVFDYGGKKFVFFFFCVFFLKVSMSETTTLVLSKSEENSIIN